MGDPARDRRGLPGASPRENADRPAHGLRSAPLLGIQPFENVHPSTLPGGAAGFVTALCQFAGLVKRVFEHREAEALGGRNHLAEPGRHAEHVVLGDERLQLGKLVLEPNTVDRCARRAHDLRVRGLADVLAVVPELLVHLLAGP